MEEKDLWNEQWKEYFEEGWLETDRYLISNYGRIKRRKYGSEEFTLNKGSILNGYTTISGRRASDKKTVNRYLHKVIGDLFLRRLEKQDYVIHLDYNKLNNKANNLRWATGEEKNAHLKKDPARINRKTNTKLTETQVIRLKRILNDPNRKTRLKLIAKQFGVSEMQLHRIKTGENWSEVKY